MDCVILFTLYSIYIYLQKYTTNHVPIYIYCSNSSTCQHYSLYKLHTVSAVLKFSTNQWLYQPLPKCVPASDYHVIANSILFNDSI